MMMVHSEDERHSPKKNYTILDIAPTPSSGHQRIASVCGKTTDARNSDNYVVVDSENGTYFQMTKRGLCKVESTKLGVSFREQCARQSGFKCLWEEWTLRMLWFSVCGVRIYSQLFMEMFIYVYLF